MITKPHFSGHETFALRYSWLKKGLDAVIDDGGVFAADDALVRLGVGKNMVRAIRHWGLATGVLQEEPGTRGRVIEASSFGLDLLGDDGWDPYLEDPASLWLIHWHLTATPGRATTWYWLFNEQPAPEFTVDGVVQSLIRMAKEQGWPKVTENSLRRDADCCVRTYHSARKTARAVIEDTLDCPLNELRLVRGGMVKGTYHLTREPRETLPPAVFAYGLHAFVQARDVAKSVPLDDLLFQPGSPGRVFGLDDNGLMRLIDELSSHVDAIQYDETAGLKQVRIAKGFDPELLLEQMYAARGAHRSVA